MAHLRLQLLKLSSPLILALAVVGANSALAQSPQASDRVPFTLEGRSWVNQKAFIDSGLRCGVRPLDAGEARAVDEALRVRLELKPDKPNPGKGGGPGGGGGGGGEGGEVSYAGEINVYFHVIHSGSVGLLSAEEIADQMAGAQQRLSGYRLLVQSRFDGLYRQRVLVWHDPWLKRRVRRQERTSGTRSGEPQRLYRQSFGRVPGMGLSALVRLRHVCLGRNRAALVYVAGRLSRTVQRGRYGNS